MLYKHHVRFHHIREAFYLFGIIRNMDIDEEEVEASLAVSSLTRRCDICARMGTDDSRVLTEFVVDLCKSHTLPVVMQETASFLRATARTKNSDMKNVAQQGGVAGEYTAENIELHIKSCIAPRETSLKTIIRNHEIMFLLQTATDFKQKYDVLKLLLQVEASEKRK